MRDDSYLRPVDLDGALAALADAPLRVAAGCTDLFAATESKVLPGPVLDITGIAALRGIRRDADGLWIGATTTWADIARADLPPALWALQEAAREVGAQQVQNAGTLGGNLCNASPAADGVPPLLALDAEVSLACLAGTRRVALSAFLTGPRQTQRREGELLTGVWLPERALTGASAFRKLGARRYLVISIAMVAARIVLSGGKVSDAAISVGACGPVATRLPLVEAALRGNAPEAGLIRPEDVAQALSPIVDMRADAGYRFEAATQLVRDTVLRAAGGRV